MPPMPFEKHVMRQIPCAAYANPDAALYVGPGALISPELFEEELRALARWRSAGGLPPRPVVVDPRAQLITEDFIERERNTELATRIGSTSAIAGEGIGAAQAARVMREPGCLPVSESPYTRPGWRDRIVVAEIDRVLNQPAIRDGVLLEGTQGTGLSLTTGCFPYVTSRNTTTAGLCADAAFAPANVGRVILVVRTHPIRVAGSSGPFHRDSEEISWERIGIDPRRERTTVTGRVRRVATFSHDQVAASVDVNGATEIALMFADHLDPSVFGMNAIHWDEHPLLSRFIDEIEARCGIPVSMCGTGPHTMIDNPDRPCEPAPPRGSA